MSEEKPRLISLYADTDEHYSRAEGMTYFSFAQDLPDDKVRWWSGSVSDERLLELLKSELKETVRDD